MDASQVRRFVLGALLVLLGVVAGASPGRAACDPTTDPDKTDIANARAAVAANCNCAGATSHGAYVICAVQQANLTLVNKRCAGAVKQCASHSTCGRPAGAVTCCLTKAGATKCKIRRDAAHCKAPNGGAACVGSATSCCDACGSAGCAPTTTTLPPCTSLDAPCGSCGTGLCFEHCGTGGNGVCLDTTQGGAGNGCSSDADCPGDICVALPGLCGQLGPSGCSAGAVPCP